MKEKIYNYLVDKNKGVPPAEIIEEFFCVSGQYPSQMENVVDSILKNDERFIRDEVGEWSVKKIRQRLLTDMMFSIIELETVTIDHQRELPLFMGIAQVQNSKMISNHIFSLEILWFIMHHLGLSQH